MGKKFQCRDFRKKSGYPVIRLSTGRSPEWIPLIQRSLLSMKNPLDNEISKKNPIREFLKKSRYPRYLVIQTPDFVLKRGHFRG